MIEDCHIRAFTPSDLKRLHQIRERAFRPVFQSFRSIVGEEIAAVAFASAEREQAEYLDQLCREGSTCCVYVVEYGSQAVAFFAVTLDRSLQIGEIDLNAVDPDFQGRGIGTLMYQFALDRMRGEGMRIATVGTGGDPSHGPARKAYEKAGFGVAIPNLYLYRTL